MKIAFTWDDGAPEDKKLFALHEKYGVPALFFVPTRNCEGRRTLTPEDIRSAPSELCDFGGHTETHRYLTTLQADEWEGEIENNLHYLEDTLGRPVPHFAFPGGQYNEAILAEVYRHFQTARAGDTMNFHNTGTLIKPTFHVYPRGRKSLLGNAWRHNGRREIVFLLTHINQSYFTLIERLIELEAEKNPTAEIIFLGHGWELEEQGLWAGAERILQFVTTNFKMHCVPYDNLF